MSTGAWIAIAAVAAALAFGAYRRRTDGRFRGLDTLADARYSTTETAETPVGRVADARDERRRIETTATEGVWADVRRAIPEAELGAQATLLQFSSAFCAPCRATRRTLAEVAEVVPGVAHLEVDAELHLELVRALDILRTPTTLVLDASGREVTRATGAPRKEHVVAALGQA